MAGLGGYVWFIGLGAALVILALAMVYASNRKRVRGGDPNAAGKQAAAETGHPEVAKLGAEASARPPRGM